MKNYLFNYLTVLLLLFAISCSSDDGDNSENPSEPSYLVSFNGDTFTDGCGDMSDYSVEVEFVSDGNVEGANDWNGSSSQTLSDSRELSGDVIGVRLTLLNFDSSSQTNGRGSGLESIRINITNPNSGTSVLDANLFDLFICTDSVYGVLFSYDTMNDSFTEEYEQFGF
ncbi:hypothetical protein BST97_09645 [Nonlabens spongiae]|uniref:Uncharacterized protein n=1 Tax=Nonlabens spongiae TaxID=331648 RepID=A0A1W6MKX1_9FLAO|nr:hypothetical protein [Nonlabens spongiae]ARN78233.1 hypothetical protein BST97_09645 [Nonlabens spongiae]